VQVVAEADRGDAVEADLDVVRGEIPQARGHQPHQAVEHDLEHRQAFIGNPCRAEDGAHTALVVRIVGDVEAQQTVDLVLVQDALGVRGGIGSGLCFLIACLFGHERTPYWTIISLSSTSWILYGAAATLMRRRSSSFRRSTPADPLRSSI